MTATANSSWRKRSQALLETAPADPKAVAGAGRALAAEAAAAGDLAAASVALRAAGLAELYLSRIPAAGADLAGAVEMAVRAGNDALAAEARMTQAVALLYAGRTAESVATIDAARVDLRGLARVRAEVQRAGILARIGDGDGALEGFRRALPAIRRAGDQAWEARVLVNRALVELDMGMLGQAEADLLRARRACRAAEQLQLVADTTHDLAIVAARRGDVPTALRRFDEAEDLYEALEVPPGSRPLERCDMLMAVGLFDEARAIARRTVDRLEAEGLEIDRGEALLVCSHAELLAGDAGAAVTAAEAATAVFAAQRRQAWAARSRYAEAKARERLGELPAGYVARARRLARTLEAAGMAQAALDCHLLAGRLALAEGRREIAHQELERGAPAARVGPIQLRLAAWHLRALARLAEGNGMGADAACRAGMRTLYDYQLALGATDARVHVAGHARQLAAVGLRLAIESGRAGRVYSWMERFRAGSLLRPPVHPPRDSRLAADLAALRTTAHAIRQAESEGSDTAELWGRQRRLQEAVRRRTLAVSGSHRNGRQAVPAIDQLRAALSGATLVEWAGLDGRLVAVVLGPNRMTWHELGQVDPVEAELEQMRFGLSRLAGAATSAASRTAARQALARTAADLDRRLLRPLPVGEGPLVLIAPAVLHSLPWSLLPSCRRRPVTVAPSAAAWLRAATRRRRRRASTVLAAGPGLSEAAAEVRALARLHPDATRLPPRSATVAAVTEAMDGATLVHVAAHASFQADNAMFSSLRLADGPLMVYDLERLRSAPDTVILSACESGLSAARPGDEIMGLSAALLGLGTGRLLATTSLVPDAAATRRAMVDVHRELAGGSSLAAALAATQAAAAERDDADFAARHAFVCYGAG